MVVAGVLSPSTSTVEFDLSVVQKMRQSGPRYKSYPTTDRFTDAFDYRDYLQAVASMRTHGTKKPLSIYVHIPFCDMVCDYCDWNKVVGKKVDKAATYLSYLKREIAMQGQLFVGMNTVEQLHFGGGTPTYISDAQMDDLMTHLRRWFRFSSDEIGEYSIEINPLTTSADRVHSLRRQGFNRISFGIQNLDEEVHKAPNHIQPTAQVFSILGAARDAGFRSISVDLMYGFPLQTIETISRTLAATIDAKPDRIAIYNYTHSPHLFKPHCKMTGDALPNTETKLDLLALCIRTLTEAGYTYIGMNHFAKPDDDLAIAQQQGRLHRNFQGYSIHADSDMVSCGVSAISAVGMTYSQNVKTLEAYYDRIDKNELPIARGIKLSMDDVLRRRIIQMLMCNFELSISSIESAYPIVFADYFCAELKILHELEQDGLLSVDDGWLSVSGKGRFVIRNICMIFDHYLDAFDKQQGFSKTHLM